MMLQTQMFLRRAVSLVGLLLTFLSAVVDAVVPCGVPLPAPKGPFKVGRIERHWVDPSRAPWITPDVPFGKGRQLHADIWYPCTSDPDELKKCRWGTNNDTDNNNTCYDKHAYACQLNSFTHLRALLVLHP
jgi:hypothetical protein